MILFQILRFYGLDQIEPGWHQVQVSVVVCDLHAYDKTVCGPKDLSMSYSETHQVNATGKQRSKIVPQTPLYMDWLSASFASSKSIFYMAKLLVAFNPVSKEESVSNASFCMCNNYHHSS